MGHAAGQGTDGLQFSGLIKLGLQFSPLFFHLPSLGGVDPGPYDFHGVSPGIGYHQKFVAYPDVFPILFLKAIFEFNVVFCANLAPCDHSLFPVFGMQMLPPPAGLKGFFRRVTKYPHYVRTHPSNRQTFGIKRIDNGRDDREKVYQVFLADDQSFFRPLSFSDLLFQLLFFGHKIRGPSCHPLLQVVLRLP